jgi:hypothetical protein
MCEREMADMETITARMTKSQETTCPSGVASIRETTYISCSSSRDSENARKSGMR